MRAAKVQPDSQTHTALVMAYEKSGDWRQALEAFSAMRRAGLHCNSFTYRALIAAAVQAQQLDLAMQVRCIGYRVCFSCAAPCCAVPCRCAQKMPVQRNEHTKARTR